MKAFAAALALLAVALPARAGVYSPDEPFNFEIAPDGFARPIQFAGGFEVMVAGVREVAILPPADGPPNVRRQEALDRVRARQAKGVAALSAEELAGLTADLIRLNRADEVLNLLQPLVRDRQRGGFLVSAHLARAHAARGEWAEARALEEMAVLYSDFPTAFGKLTKPQLAWLKRVEREFYYPFLAHRAEEALRGRPSDLREDVDPLFPPAGPRKRVDNPVRFVGENGEYAPGSVAAAEKARLPPDALAVAQQLVLWHPQDARLYWLLGELYNADGDVETAARILDHCSYNMGYSNRTLVRHRQILNEAVSAAAAQRAAAAEQSLQAAAAEKAREAEEKRQREEAERDYQKRFWWILSIGVALGLVLVYYQVREVARRLRRAGRVA